MNLLAQSLSTANTRSYALGGIALSLINAVCEWFLFITFSELIDTYTEYHRFKYALINFFIFYALQQITHYLSLICQAHAKSTIYTNITHQSINQFLTMSEPNRLKYKSQENYILMCIAHYSEHISIICNLTNNATGILLNIAIAYQLLSKVAYVFVSLSLLNIWISIYLSKRITALFDAYKHAQQLQCSSSSNMFSHLKEIKLMNLIHSEISHQKDIKKQELQKYKEAKFYQGLINAFLYLSPCVVIVFTYCTKKAYESATSLVDLLKIVQLCMQIEVSMSTG